MWIVWLIAAGGFAVGEMHFSTGFYLAPFALGAAVATVASLAGAGAVISLVCFIAVALLALAVLRPIAVRHMKVPPRLRTGTAALIGKQAVVLERIANDEGMGTVRIDGEVWTARSYNDDDVIEGGTRVDVVDIRGATALVTE
ncbi:MAG TPA: NfeD family protein [Solirubrobacteraceae bacterium]|jgi:membrane protein implicated in regulation of membrane protease activity|nr:NfeD family protein [Solirubrobacteraceae bacterium]